MGVWTSWNEWSTCSVSCGDGVQFRERACLQPLTGSQQCEGEGQDVKPCQAEKCRGRLFILCVYTHSGSGGVCFNWNV